ncbi:MAG: bifunctional aspartate kinase/homoserine dehydrogenase I, partial [Muribaculaceae bacterium]|nr:bifunctional aspartate kinase/homoserine dehydrogenase I [Muribaculaceae bacterium]
GRGGSDYTAAIVASALNADSLEIWTDVDGFMTADPKVDPTATVIRQMTYEQAQHMCDQGAKVIYAPTIKPVAEKHIPIWVKNTFNRGATGTLIAD